MTQHNEGIDVEAEAVKIDAKGLLAVGTWCMVKDDIVALCAKVRAETEAAVTKRVILMAREEIKKELPNVYTHEQWCLKNLGGCFEKKVAYESNDAGEKP